MSGRGKGEERATDLGEATVWGLTPESPRKKMRRSSSDQSPTLGGETNGNAMIELLLDMTSQMEAMEELGAQHNKPCVMGI